MGKINRFLLTAIAMVAIMIAAVGVDRGLKYYEARRWEKERVARYEQAYAEAADIRMTIKELSRDKDAIEAFIEENRAYFDEDEEQFLLWESGMGESLGEPGFDGAQESSLTQEGNGDIPGTISGESIDIPQPGTEGVSENQITEGPYGEGDISGGQAPGEPGDYGSQGQDISGNWIMDNSGNGIWDVSGNGAPEVSGNGIWGISGNGTPEVSGNGIWGISGNGAPGVSGNGIWDITGSQATDISGNKAGGISGNSAMYLPAGQGGSTISGNTLLEKRKVRGSYMETRMQNKSDLKVIAHKEFDFSGMSIACLGDSITQAANLDDMENYQQYSYPTRLKELLGAKNVTNLGIGGSSIGRYWENAFVDRFREIPQDTDLIIVMGGTNDGFCLDQEDFGTMEERKPRTFLGDLDELMRGLKESYPEADIIFVTPLPNVLHDMLRKERSELLSQTVIAGAIRKLGAEHGIPVIDLYNSNVLDTHDAAVIYNYMPDGVHCNEDGYVLLAERIAAELIRFYENREGFDGKSI
ncbi:hypothetical protein IMSAGC019_03322 [Lachnospiraceae bacterium]|nr:hypothetical protein IMSAGC019_03322 [Lachnospiraceae bacterium]